ncbi:hypothetical protein [Shimia aestuarii]|nr:hypothetical protein [Shimia aestuarii]
MVRREGFEVNHKKLRRIYRENLGLTADTFLSRLRVTRELNRAIAEH